MTGAKFANIADGQASRTTAVRNIATTAGTPTVDPTVSLATGYTSLGEWNTTASFENWTTTNVTGATVANGTLMGTGNAATASVSRTGIFSGPDLDLGFNDELEVRVQVTTSFAGDVHVYFGSTDPAVASPTGISTARMLTIPNALLAKDGALHVYRLEMGLVIPWRGTLTAVSVELTSASGVAFAVDYVRVGDLAGDVYTARITVECPAAGGTTPPAALYGANSTTYSAESKHFRFLWNDTVAANSFWTANMVHGTLRNAEECWQVHAKLLGYVEPCYNIGTTGGTKYRLNITSWHAGYFAGPDGGSDGTNLARLNIEPSGLRVDVPTWVIPHELMHCFQFHTNLGYMPGEWYEFHANYGRERWLEYTKEFYPGVSALDPNHLRCHQLDIGAGREYYLCWPFFLYIDENPDSLPDLGEGTGVKLWSQTQAGEYPYMTLERLTPTSSIQDIAGYYARRCVTYNFSDRANLRAAIASFDPANARWQFTDLVQRPDDPTWWRVPFEMTPMQGAFTTHQLIPIGTGAGRVVTVNLRGLPDSGRGADWRASFVVVATDGSERYSNLWNSGSNSVTLAANENTVYLTVAGAPANFYYGGADESVYPYRSCPAKTRFPYELQITGATPVQRDNGSAAGLVQHANGGGYKASTATVASTVYLGPNARVLGTATVSGNVQILDYAVVQDTAQVSGGAVLSGHALVRGNAVVTGNAKVRDWGMAEGGTVQGDARILEHGDFKGGTATDQVTVKGTAAQILGNLTGNAMIDGDYGDYYSGRDIANALAFGHQPYVGAPDSFLTPLPTGLYARYDFATAHDSRILDRYGVTDGFTVGSPTWVAADARRKGFLTFDGSTQSVILDRSVADLRAFTFTAWIKPQGGAANQAVLWLGAGAPQRMYFTPDDGAGHARFAIVNGGTEYTLSGASLPPGTWTHVAVTLDGTTGTLYLNGTAAASTAIPIRADQMLAPNTATGLQQNYLARSAGTILPNFCGALDDVQFYGAALAASDVAALQPPISPFSAGALYVDLRASSSTAGTATWTSGGTAGSFTRVGSPSLFANVGGTGVPGVLFNGTNQAYVGPNSNADIDGGSDRSIEVWAYNPVLADEESMVSWGYRGTDRSDLSFNFGSASPWSAATHWGDDVAWATTPGAGAWHHLVYTYNGNVTAQVYLDGARVTSKTLGGVLTTFAGQPINIACQRDTANGTRSHFYGGYLNSVRVHGGVLPPAQIAGNYSLGPFGSPGNAAPTLTAIADQSVPTGGSVSIPFTVNDADTAVSALTLGGSAANASLVPAANFTYNGTGTSRTVVIRPALGLTGTTQVTITVSDGAATASRSFNLTVSSQARLAWLQQYFGDAANSPAAADAADPDGDGVPNLLERAFGGNPLAAERNLLPAVDNGGPLLSISYRKADAATDLAFTVQECSDLAAGTWTNSAGTSTVLSDDGIVQRIRYTAQPGAAGRKFLRVLLTQP